MNRILLVSFLTCAALASFVPTANAQSSRPAIEGAVGKSWFVDDASIPPWTWSGAARWYLTRRLAVGPEITYMVGPGDDRDLIVTGNATFDVRPAGPTPFVVGGGGLFRHSNRFNGGPFSSTEGAFTAGGGVRVPFGSGWYVAPEARIGWELHTRFQRR